jgi:hypothetical protein
MDKQNRGITRRGIAAAIALPLLAQAPESKPASELESAQAQLRRTSEQLRQFRTPMLLEPGFIFKP